MARVAACVRGGARERRHPHTRTHTGGDASLEKCLVTRADINPGPLKTGRVKNSGAKGAQHPWSAVVGRPGYLCSDGWSLWRDRLRLSLSLSAPLSAISRSLAKLFIFFAVRKIVLNRGWKGKIGKLFLNIGLNGRLIRDVVITVTTIGREI